MKLKAYDNERDQYIPQSDFAVTGDGRILIARDTELSMLLYPSSYPIETVFTENMDVPDSSVTITVDEED